MAFHLLLENEPMKNYIYISNQGNNVIDLLDSLNLQNKYFRMYKDNLKAANDYASAGDKEALQRLCVNEVRSEFFLLSSSVKSAPVSYSETQCF